jgi:hypothetical protein
MAIGAIADPLPVHNGGPLNDEGRARRPAPVETANAVQCYQLPPLQPPPPVQDLVTTEPTFLYVKVLPDFDVPTRV